MSEVAKGACLCGQYSYYFPRAAMVSAHHCHCQDCRRATGSGKATIALVPFEALATTGELKVYTVTGSEGAHVSRGFCPNCGSQILSFVEEMPALRMIKAGTLDDSHWLEISSSFWACSAESWSPVDSACPAFERNPTQSL